MEKTDNELIAEFMELMVFKNYDDMSAIPIEKLKPWVYVDQCKYHDSWDWLMPVVQKFIEKAKATDMPHALYMNVHSFTVNRPISELYDNLVAGIKWHNANP